MRDFNHKKQIVFMLLNNLAQSLYLSKKLNYDQIIPYIMKNMDKFNFQTKLSSLSDILKFISAIKKQIHNV